MARFRKKPIVVEAVSCRDAALAMAGCGHAPEWIAAACAGGTLVFLIAGDGPGDAKTSAIIRTLEGDMGAEHDDFIIRGVGGELYPCKSDIFTATYEEVT